MACSGCRGWGQSERLGTSPAQPPCQCGVLKNQEGSACRDPGHAWRPRGERSAHIFNLDARGQPDRSTHADSSLHTPPLPAWHVLASAPHVHLDRCSQWAPWCLSPASWGWASLPCSCLSQNCCLSEALVLGCPEPLSYN